MCHMVLLKEYKKKFVIATSSSLYSPLGHQVSRSLISAELFTNQNTVDTFQITQMSSYTPADIRNMVDDFDALIREAVGKGNIKDVFTRERYTLVSKVTV